MVIWLRNPQCEGAAAGSGIGVDGDVLRGEQLATLVDIDTAWREMRAQGEAELSAAGAQAQALLADAEAQAAELEARAAQRYEHAAGEGYEAGLREALADWHARVMRSPDADGLTPQRRQRDRLAQLVALAVEQMVAASDPADLFRRAAATLEQIVADGSPLEVRVHPADLRAATVAFGEAGRSWREVGCAVRLRVQADAALEPGSCQCESDLGAVDASLSLQLAAMREALARAVNSMADEADEDDPLVEDTLHDAACAEETLYDA